MKKSLFLFGLMSTMAVSSFAVETAKCVLQHEETVKIYDASKIVNAINDAVNGDLLFLTEGEFPGFILDKQITVRGAGQNSVILGDITVSIPNNPVLSQVLFEGIYGNKIVLDSKMDGIKLNQCRFSSLSANALNSDITIDRCDISNLIQSSNIGDMNIKNSKLNSITTYYTSTTSTNAYYYGAPKGDCLYTNCTINSFKGLENSKSVVGTFVNCIIISSNFYYNATTIDRCIFVNCLLKKQFAATINCSFNNCYYDSSITKDVSNSYLESNGYLGQDANTLVGANGGFSAYTLDLSIPKVTSSTISLDNENKKLNVSIKVTAN